MLETKKKFVELETADREESFKGVQWAGGVPYLPSSQGLPGTGERDVWEGSLGPSGSARRLATHRHTSWLFRNLIQRQF